jgi:cell division protein DivIC
MEKRSLFDYIKSTIPIAYRPLMNKFLVATLFFCIWMLFFDRSRVINQIKLEQTLRSLQTQKEYYERNIQEVKERKEELFTTDENFEKFAREQHLMKKSNEEVFVIEDE